MEDLQNNEKLPDTKSANDDVHTGEILELVNASGHKQELDRNFGIWSICAISVCTDNAWAAGGGSLVSFGIPFLTRRFGNADIVLRSARL
jgi:hypothetical protein